jgi:glutamate synthase (NADPH/NADH) small chain
MGDIKGFLKVKREAGLYRPVCERVKDFSEVHILRKDSVSRDQASRCMDCGTPFCHWGCPLGNLIFEWNDAVFRGHWEKALKLLDNTNNWPEVTGRICPALCEYSCVLGINDDPVTIRENELAIIEYAFKKKLIKPHPPEKRSGKKVAVIGSGPAGLSCAAELNKFGHKVTVFEKDDAIGGILRYGIPDFKLEKWILERRLKILKEEGVVFKVSANVGVNLPLEKLKDEFDAICLACGSRTPRDLNIPGRELKGIHFAMQYLVQSNKRVAGGLFTKDKEIYAKGKKVVVIGGGDTGADCVGTAHRQGAACVVQIELLSRPPESRTGDFPWPKYPVIFKSSTSHEEGGERQWSVSTEAFLGENGSVRKLSCTKKEVPGSEFEIEADLVVLAMGFLHPEKDGPITQLGLALDKRGNVSTDANYMSSVKGVFSAGDMRRGQSLVVWAIDEGRRAAMAIHSFLLKNS